MRAYYRNPKCYCKQCAQLFPKAHACAAHGMASELAIVARQAFHKLLTAEILAQAHRPLRSDEDKTSMKSLDVSIAWQHGFASHAIIGSWPSQGITKTRRRLRFVVSIRQALAIRRRHVLPPPQSFRATNVRSTPPTVTCRNACIRKRDAETTLNHA
jgi:hypothetical protein